MRKQFPIGFGLFVLLMGSSLGALFFISSAVTHGPSSQGRSARKQVALTFDDGPNPVYTERVLALLEQAGAKATFFVLGRNLELYPHLARRLIQSGNEVANHGYSHQAMSELSFEDQRREVETTENLLRAFGASPPFWYRPAYGHLGFPMRLWLAWSGRKWVLWSRGASVEDYHRQNPALLTDRLIRSIAPGAILLLHDGEGLRPETLETLQRVLEHLAQREYQAVTVSELLSRPQ